MSTRLVGHRSSTVAGLGLLLLALAFGCAERGLPSARPNVLIVTADDLAWRALGMRIEDESLTPRLDRLAQESVVFEHATASSPFCTPSRQSFLTGRWPHAIGVTQVNSLLPAGATTLGDVFRGAGYRTAAFGKMHWQRKRSQGVDRGFDVVADIEEWRQHLSPEDRAAYEAHRDLWRERGEAGWSHLNLGGEPVPLADELQYASWIVDRTLEFIQAAGDESFLAFCSFTEVHAPFAFPPSLAGRVGPQDVVLPAASLSDLRDSAPGVLASFRARERQRGELTDDARRRAIAAYLTSAAWLDSQVGRLLDGLHALEADDDTIVVFWSDHGFQLGEHGLISKSVPFREVLEAPLFVRAPGLAPARRDGLVQMLDVFPTLCELADVEAPAGLDGRSLVPVLVRGEAVRDEAYSEFIGLWGALRTERWKLVLGHEPQSGFDQLYDLEHDPGEQQNRFDDPALAQTIRDLTERIQRLLQASPADWMERADWMAGRTGTDAVRWALGQIER